MKQKVEEGWVEGSTAGAPWPPDSVERVSGESQVSAEVFPTTKTCPRRGRRAGGLTHELDSGRMSRNVHS